MPKGKKQVVDGIYRDESGSLYIRDRSGSRDSFKKLPVKRMDEAKRYCAELRLRQAAAKDGVTQAISGCSLTVGQVLHEYEDASCPDRRRTPKSGTPLEQDQSRIKILREWWDQCSVSEIRVRTLDDYADWRKGVAHNGRKTEGRAIDLELNCLRNALNWAVRRELIGAVPMNGKWPRYSPMEKDVTHCYELRPANADELHAIAEKLINTSRSQVFGWWLLFQAFTGLRRGEPLSLRWDAKKGEPGYMDEKYLYVQREKRGSYPWIVLHPSLKTLISELRAWRDKKHPESPWYFPSFMDDNQPADGCSYAHAVTRAAVDAGIQERRTTHGARAYYVTVRRSQGINDLQIAAEIGHTTGGSTLKKAYGDIPPNWFQVDHPELTWLPTGRAPAWDCLKESEQPTNITKLVLEPQKIPTSEPPTADSCGSERVEKSASNPSQVVAVSIRCAVNT